MLNLGLTSVTFNSLSPAEIIDYCKFAGVGVIEWAGRTHAIAGEPEGAREIKRLSDEAGIKISSYGSYYKCGTYESAAEEFSKHIEIAKILGAKTIRIWTGTKNFSDADEEYIDKIVEELRLMSDMAEEEGIEIGCEFHNGTVTNTRASSLEICKRVGKGNFGMYFQYDPRVDVEENMKTLRDFLPLLKNVHVFNVTPEIKRNSISDEFGMSLWQGFVAILKESNKDANLILEFLPDPTRECLVTEADAIRKIRG